MGSFVRELAVVYDEAVDGALPDAGNPLPTFTLDGGVNTISGTIASRPAFDADSFAFIVPAGEQLTAGRGDPLQTRLLPMLSSG